MSVTRLFLEPKTSEMKTEKSRKKSATGRENLPNFEEEIARNISNDK